MIGKYSSTIKISDGLLALRLLGTKMFVQKLREQLYSRTPFLCVGKELDSKYVSQATYKGGSLLPATSDDVADFFQLMAKESRRSRYELLVRKRFYQKGFKDCYIGRDVDSKEMCSIAWMVTSKDVEKTGSENIYPGLKQEEIFGENTYTLGKFRGKGIMTSTGLQQEEIARGQGFTRMLFYVKENNIPSLKSSIKRGHLAYSRLLRCHFLCHVKMKTLERFDAPIPIVIPNDAPMSESR